MNLLLVDDEKLALEALKKAVLGVLPESEVHPFQKARMALEYAEDNKIDIAFLDIDMPVISGLEMAKKLQEIYPNINIIFVTGFSEYALDAFNVYASGYLTKPVTEEGITGAINHLRHPIISKRVRFQCFGNFEAYCDNKPIPFSLNKTKELLAYLVDRKGAECRKNEIIATLFEDDFNIEYYKKLRKDLIETFGLLEIANVLRVSRGGFAINKELVVCDYYDYLDSNKAKPPKEYMSQYSFAEKTFASLQDFYEYSID